MGGCGWRERRDGRAEAATLWEGGRAASLRVGWAAAVLGEGWAADRALPESWVSKVCQQGAVSYLGHLGLCRQFAEISQTFNPIYTI